SGTIGAAREALFHGIPAIAVSVGRGADLTVAAELSRQFVVALLDAGADPMATDAHGNTALHQSALWRQPDITALLIARGVELDATQRHGRTAVHDAVRADCAAALEHLLAAGAKADIADAEGKLPIDHAGPHSSPRIRELLAKK
ncbi:MAG: ankyrin repeat domain-containing protein, partial [Planctomycetes bacterium]|nr:ankyrin repeat domain-containing protein [Planctomycetota bacterium]